MPLKSPQARRTYTAAYYKENATEIKQQKKDYYRKNQKAIKQRSKTYRESATGRRRIEAYREIWRANPANRMRKLVTSAFLRSKLKKLPYSNDLLDLLMSNPPSHCACCNRKMDYSIGRGMNRDESPSLDRKDNHLGYTIENTFVICWRCNTIKSNATLHELESILRYVQVAPASCQ